MTSFDHEQIAQLAQIAGVSEETKPCTINKFQDLLVEAAIAFGSAPKSMKMVRRKLGAAAKQARDLSSNLEPLIFRVDILQSMLDASDEVSGKTQFEFQELNELRQRLQDLAMVLDVARKYPNMPKSGGGRPRDTGHMTAAICFLANAWEEAMPGRKATTVTCRDTGDKGGPFVNFARSAFEFLDPNFYRRTGFGQTVFNALAVRKSVLRGLECG